MAKIKLWFLLGSLGWLIWATAVSTKSMTAEQAPILKKRGFLTFIRGKSRESESRSSTESRTRSRTRLPMNSSTDITVTDITSASAYNQESVADLNVDIESNRDLTASETASQRTARTGSRPKNSLEHERRLLLYFASQEIGKYQWCTCRVEFPHGMRLRDSHGRRNHYAQEIIREHHRRSVKAKKAKENQSRGKDRKPKVSIVRRLSRYFTPSRRPLHHKLFECVRPSVEESSSSLLSRDFFGISRNVEKNFPRDQSRFNCWQFLFLMGMKAGLLTWNDIQQIEYEALIWMQRRRHTDFYYATILAALNFDQSVKLEIQPTLDHHHHHQRLRFRFSRFPENLFRSESLDRQKSNANSRNINDPSRSVCPPVGAIVFFDGTAHVVMSVPDPSKPFPYDTSLDSVNTHITDVFDCPVIQLWLDMSKNWAQMISPKQCGSHVSHTTIGTILKKMNYWKTKVDVRYSLLSIRRFIYLDEKGVSEAIWRSKTLLQRRKSVRSQLV